jgi:integrase
MARIFKHSAKVEGREPVGYGLKIENGAYYVRFLDKDNQRRKRSLELSVLDGKAGKKEKQANEAEAHRKAVAVICQMFAAPLPTKDKVTWDEAANRLTKAFKASGNRSTTLDNYLKDMALVRAFYKSVEGPGDVDESMAQTWLDDYTTAKDKRAKYVEGKQHSPHSVASRLSNLSALWGKWFHGKLKIVKVNPFANLKPPKADKPSVKWVNDSQLEEFFAWLEAEYPGWEFPKLFFRLKTITGCRLDDICNLRPGALRDGGVMFSATIVKGRQDRFVPLDKLSGGPELSTALKAYSEGKEWLWEAYPVELRPILKRKGFPVHRLQDDFAPSRLYSWVGELFKTYNKRPLAEGEQPGERQHITSHQFRKRAFTLAHQHGIDASTASIMFGCGIDVIHRHYVELDERKMAAAGFERMAGVLGGKMADTEPRPQFGHNSE